MQTLGNLKNQAEFWNNLTSQVNELLDLTKISNLEQDIKLSQEIEKQFYKLDKEFKKHELELTLSEKYDQENALLMIHAGTGGIDAQDWAEMLLRMYLRFSEKKGWKADLVDKNAGTEAGIKSATVEIKGDYVYGYLKSEAGIHRLVRRSPFDADQLRHTSFALIEVIPEIKEEKEIKINPKDLKIETFRASGPGGQHVNVTSSAVRITHIPTNITVSCQSERSQFQNKKTALRILLSKLHDAKMKEKEKEKIKIRGKHIEAKWGNQIRSYILHPYKMVKDHRTGYEVKNADAVLDGELNGFVEAYLKKNIPLLTEFCHRREKL